MESAHCCLVGLAPCLHVSGAGCTQKLENCSYLTTWSRELFSTQQQLIAQKGENKVFFDNAVPFTSSCLKRIQEISGNHNWHCYFEGLMAYIITLYFLLSPLVYRKRGWWFYCTAVYGSSIPPKHTFYT